MKPQTVIRVIEVVPIRQRGTSVILVDIVQGEPHIGMKLTTSPPSGEWEVVGFGSGPVDAMINHPTRINLMIYTAQEGQEIGAGSQLIEVR